MGAEAGPAPAVAAPGRVSRVANLRPTVRKLLLTVAAVLGTGLAATACNPVTPYAAVVNGTVITQSALNSELAAIAGNKSDVASIEAGATSNGAASLTITGPGPGTYGATFASEVLRQEILYVLIQQELVKHHVTVTSYDMTAARADVPGALQGSGQTAVALNDFPRAYQNLLTQRQADLEALEADLAGQTLTQASVAGYYATHAGEFYEACASRIEVASALAALGVEADLAKGTSFAAEAAAKSTDTQTSSQGGQLGCGSGLQFTSSFGSAFSQAVATTPIGKPSAAVPGPNGYDIVEVSQRQPLPLDTAYSQIRQQLTSAGSTALESLLSADVARAAVTVDARYGTWSAKSVNGNSGVIPPSVPAVRSDLAPAPAG